MHKFLRAVGFSGIKRDEDLLQYLELVVHEPDTKSTYESADGFCFVELKKEFGKRAGLAVCGSYRDKDEFNIEYYYPFVRGERISTQDPMEAERHSDKNAYAGLVDDVRMGITLIYYLQNINDYFAYKSSKSKLVYVDTILTGLCTEGRVLLPVYRENHRNSADEETLSTRRQLINAAKEGDEDAIESLTIEDMDTYTMLSKRVVNENILSIVNTSMMPYGIESDQYVVVGDITDVSSSVNKYTGEEMYLLSVESRGIPFDVCVNKKDLEGDPQIGRRFRGIVWMQGRVARKRPR